MKAYELIAELCATTGNPEARVLIEGVHGFDPVLNLVADVRHGEPVVLLNNYQDEPLEAGFDAMETLRAIDNVLYIESTGQVGTASTLASIREFVTEALAAAEGGQ